MTLAEFLLARIAEDEGSARDGDLAYDTYEPIPGNCWTPDRILLECEAKRRIVDLHDSTQGMAWCRSCGRPDMPNGAHEWPCSTILTLAAIYADHPDYRQEWKP